MGFVEALIIGTSQILALLAGISRDGVTMVTGMARGLSREDAARFAFLLATPVILAAGALRCPTWRARSATGSAARSCSAASCPGSARTSRSGSWSATSRPVRCTRSRIYCFVFGLLSVIYLGVIK